MDSQFLDQVAELTEFADSKSPSVSSEKVNVVFPDIFRVPISVQNNAIHRAEPEAHRSFKLDGQEREVPIESVPGRHPSAKALFVYRFRFHFITGHSDIPAARRITIMAKHRLRPCA